MALDVKDAYRDEWRFEYRETGESEHAWAYRVSIFRREGETALSLWDVDITSHVRVGDEATAVRFLYKPAALEAINRSVSLLLAVSHAKP
jgi:hypothetical protein